MITDRAAYERRSEAERWERLQRMSVEESITLGEALLTSEVMDVAAFAHDERPVCLAIALGLAVAWPARGHGAAA